MHTYMSAGYESVKRIPLWTTHTCFPLIGILPCVIQRNGNAYIYVGRLWKCDENSCVNHIHLLPSYWHPPLCYTEKWECIHICRKVMKVWWEFLCEPHTPASLLLASSPVLYREMGMHTYMQEGYESVMRIPLWTTHTCFPLVGILPCVIQRNGNAYIYVGRLWQCDETSCVNHTHLLPSCWHPPLCCTEKW